MHKFPHQGWAAGGAAGNFDFNRLGTGGYDAAGNNLSQTGDPFASFLLGQVHAANQSIYAQPTWYESYLAVDQRRVQGEQQAHPDARAAPGLPERPHRGERRVLDVRSEHAQPGRGGPAGRRDLRGRRAGPDGKRGRSRDPSWDAWGPRAGFAYRVNDKTMIRGGYGMYYAGVAFSQFTGDPNLGFASNPAAPNPTNGLFPAFHLDQGFPQAGTSAPPFIDPPSPTAAACPPCRRTG